jgi:hypothetical protein
MAGIVLSVIVEVDGGAAIDMLKSDDISPEQGNAYFAGVVERAVCNAVKENFNIDCAPIIRFMDSEKLKSFQDGRGMWEGWE